MLVNYNGTADTRKCLDSLRGLDRGRCRAIVVDNGSTPDASGTLWEAYPWADVVRREDNGGWAGGNNTGIRRALEQGAEWVILLNNDTVVAPELVDRLLAAVGAHPEFGVIGPIICFMDEAEVVQTDGCRFNPPGFAGFFERVEVPIAPGDPPRVAEVDIVNGCCLMAHRRVFEAVGLIDERFFLIHEESDFCLRAKAAGFACGVLAEPLVWHKGSSTFKRSGGGLQRYHDARNLALLLRKHSRTHRGGRGPLDSWRAYLRSLRHRYDHELEQGNGAAADAVVEGLCDALVGRYGPRPGRPNRLVPLARLFFDGARRIAPMRHRTGSRHASAIR